MTSRVSRSTSSSSLRFGIAVSTCSIALSMAFCSLSSSTTMASTPRPVWNLISSIACRLVGSATPRNRRLPRLNSGSTRCLASSLSLTSLTVSRSTVDGVQVEERHADIRRRPRWRCRGRLAAPLATSWVTKLVLRSSRGAAAPHACRPRRPRRPGPAAGAGRRGSSASGAERQRRVIIHGLSGYSHSSRQTGLVYPSTGPSNCQISADVRT